MLGWFAVPFVLSQSPAPVSPQEITQQSRQTLAVLYAGCPNTEREKTFVEFLRANFTKVESTSLEGLTLEQAKPFDVVVADWKSRYKRGPDGRASEYDGGSGHSKQLPKDFTKPVVMIGAVGGEIAPWSKIGWL
jgi:hypothetical protein